MMRSTLGVCLHRMLIPVVGALVVACPLNWNAAHADQPGSPPASGVAGGRWAVDPTIAGENVPPVGRSLFDFLFTRQQNGRRVYDVPFPFTALVKRLEAELLPGESGGASVKAVLIPLGRSLQRASAAPEFFAYPRVVLAVDAETRAAGRHAGMRLKDRVYLGYQEKENLIEVISYNEAAGRFEFQVVKDYRARGTVQVRYANRAVCIACHQNAAPLFSRQVWDETNANPRIAALLLKQQRNFYGVDPKRGVDVPNAIDDATDRANLYSAYQLLWRAGCASGDDEQKALRCRANVFAAALQYRLSGMRHFDSTSAAYRELVLPAMARNARAQWPAGLHIPNPDIPNRDPFMGRAAANDVDVSAAFDPLAPRPPLETWSVAEPATVARLVAGLSDFLAEADVRRIDEQLHRLAMRRKTARTEYESGCELRRTRRSSRDDRIDIDCSRVSSPDARHVTIRGQLYVHDGKLRTGRLHSLKFGAAAQTGELADIEVTSGNIVRNGERWVADLRLGRAGGRARRGDGNALEMLRLTWSTSPSGRGAETSSSSGRAVLKVVHDFAPVHDAVEQMARDTADGKLDAFSDKPFRRASLMPALFRGLGVESLTWCCLDDAGMPLPVTETTGIVTTAGQETHRRPLSLEPFFRYCATCHQSNDRSPPNFLQGTANQVSANLSHCAQRLYVRLAMWTLAPEQRQKTPMPPEYALHGLHRSLQAFRDSAELAALRDYVQRALQAETGNVPRPEELLGRSYENLRSCLP